MSSEHQVAANRTNARRSTGPRTRSGKSRSRANAVRHGLRSKRILEPQLLAQIDELAAHIAREYGKPANSPHVRIVAEAQVMILRARQARAKLLQDSNLQHVPDTQESVDAAADSSSTDNHVVPDKVLRTLAAIDRYEARALFRRQQGLRRLMTKLSCNLNHCNQEL
jgi:hypothetical protein